MLWRMHALRIVVALAATWALGSCGEDPAPRSAAATQPSVWERQPNTLGVDEQSPDFPEKLDGWLADAEWTINVRAFDNDWSPVSGADYENDYPATMNGCDNRLFLVKWRVIDTKSTVKASWQHATAAEGVAMGDALTGKRGWLVLDGCQVPLFRFGQAEGGGDWNLADVVVSVRGYNPTP